MHFYGTPFTEGKDQRLINFKAIYSVLASFSVFQHLLNMCCVLLALLESYKGSRRLSYSPHIYFDQIQSKYIYWKPFVCQTNFWGGDKYHGLVREQIFKHIILLQWVNDILRNVLKDYWSNEYFSFYTYTLN